MYDRLRNTLDGIEGSLDQVLAALGQNLYNYVVRDKLAFYSLAQEIVLDLGSCREANLDLFKSKFYQEVEHLDLLLYDHRLNQCLVAVAQVNTAPDRRFLNLFIRPLTLRVIYHRNSLIFLVI